MSRFTWNSLALCVVLAGVGLVLFCGSTAMAADPFTNDFTKDLGTWKVEKAEGKVGADGLTITKFEQFGGIMIENPPAKGADLSNAKAVTVELQNAGDSTLKLLFKIGSGAKKVTSKDINIEAGKSMTYKYPLADAEIDLTKVNYMRLFAGQAQEDGKLIIKKVGLVMKGESASKPADTKPADTKPAETRPASAKAAVLNMAGDAPPATATKPADTKPAASKPADTKPAPAPVAAGDNPYAADFTKDMGKYKLDKEPDAKQVAGEGLKITDLKKNAGPMLEGPKADISATPVIVIEIENAKNELKMNLKVKGGGKAKTYEGQVIKSGKVTLKQNLKESGIDLTKLDYVKLFGSDACDLTIKSISFVKAD